MKYYRPCRDRSGRTKVNVGAGRPIAVDETPGVRGIETG
jgi:hypothetical protein